MQKHYRHQNMDKKQARVETDDYVSWEKTVFNIIFRYLQMIWIDLGWQLCIYIQTLVFKRLCMFVNKKKEPTLIEVTKSNFSLPRKV